MKKIVASIGNGLSIEVTISDSNGQKVKIPITKEEIVVLLSEYEKLSRLVRSYKRVKKDAEVYDKDGWTLELFKDSIRRHNEEYGCEPFVFVLSPSYWGVIEDCEDFATATKIAKEAYDAIRPNNTIIWDVSIHEELYDGVSEEWVTMNQQEAMHFEKWLYDNYTKPFLIRHKDKYELL